MRVFLNIATAVCILLLTSISAKADSLSITLSAHELSVNGTMNASMIDGLVRQKWRDINRVRFSSSGGLTQDSLKIAKLLAQSHKPIIIHDICASACLDVLVIRHGVTLEPETIVLLHNTPTGQALTTTAYPNISEFLSNLGRTEEQWLAENGVDPRLLLFSEGAVVPVCVSAPEDSASAAYRLLTVTRFDAWAPRNTTLADMGIDAARRWHQDASSVIRLMQTRFPKANLARLRSADEPAIPSANIMAVFLRSVKKCRQAAILP